MRRKGCQSSPRFASSRSGLKTLGRSLFPCGPPSQETGFQPSECDAGRSLMNGNQTLFDLGQTQCLDLIECKCVREVELVSAGPPQGGEVRAAPDFLPKVMRN